jgi:anti-anti-sigma factor
VYLVGDYDVRRNRELKGLLLATEPATPLVVDCGSVRFMDSTGLSTLIEARLTLIERGSRLDLRNIPESLHAVFRVTGLEETFGGGLA